MAQRRRGERGGNSIIWPGFVDAMTALLLVLMFVLSIFLIVQFLLREELTGKDQSLKDLELQLGLLQEDLGITKARAADLEVKLAAEKTRADSATDALTAAKQEGEALRGQLQTRVAELAALTEAFEKRQVRISELEAIANALTKERDDARAAFADLKTRAERLTELEAQNAKLQSETAEIRAALAAAEKNAKQSELTLQERIAALELAVDNERKRAEEALAIAAALETKQKELGAEALARAEKLSQRDAALAFARAALATEKELSAKGREAVALLNSQVLALRKRLSELSAKLDAAEAKDTEQQVEIESLSSRLNQALARKVDELSSYRSEFFGRLRSILGNRDDVQIVGDRFVFRSEVLFASGSAELSDPGKAELARFAGALKTISPGIPKEINWILRIDGHTDKVPVTSNSEYSSNWALSQARALSVVEFLISEQGVAPERLAAAGFGEYQPIDRGSSAEALAKNRRIELRLDER